MSKNVSSTCAVWSPCSRSRSSYVRYRRPCPTALAACSSAISVLRTGSSSRCTPRAIAPDVTTTTSTPERCSPATSSHTRATTDRRSSPESRATTEEPSLTTATGMARRKGRSGGRLLHRLPRSRMRRRGAPPQRRLPRVRAAIDDLPAVGDQLGEQRVERVGGLLGVVERVVLLDPEERRLRDPGPGSGSLRVELLLDVAVPQAHPARLPAGRGGTLARPRRRAGAGRRGRRRRPLRRRPAARRGRPRPLTRLRRFRPGALARLRLPRPLRGLLRLGAFRRLRRRGRLSSRGLDGFRLIRRGRLDAFRMLRRLTR